MLAKAAGRQLYKIWQCAKIAQIEHAIFINFGSLLGCVRDKTFIKHDNDTDVCVRADWITEDQEQQFHKSLKAVGLFEYRNRETRRPDTGRLLWLSLKSELKDGVKSCVWMMFPHNGYMFHSKGDLWLTKIGGKKRIRDAIGKYRIEDFQAVCKGNSIRCFDKLVPAKFCGTDVQIPCLYGTLLDEMYPNWAVPVFGCSSDEYLLMAIRKWSEPKTWIAIP